MIITDEKLLRVICDDVLSQEIPQIREALEYELRESYKLGRPGIGLAAPQIGIAKKFAIVRLVLSDGTKINIDLANCTTDKMYDEFTFEKESCLSFPDCFVDTKRYNEIIILNNMVKPISFIATGLLAVVIQHELEHLNGVLLIDKITK